MSHKIQHVRFGSPERPLIVPEKALKPESTEGQEWWEMVASGSVILDNKTLKALLEHKDEEND